MDERELEEALCEMLYETELMEVDEVSTFAERGIKGDGVVFRLISGEEFELGIRQTLQPRQR